MRKSIRTITLILSHFGLGLSVLFLIALVIGRFFPDAVSFAHLDFFVFDYFYLIIPLLCIVSGILLQIATTHKKRSRTPKAAEHTKN